MSGHLDYINYGAAVFYRLRDLRPGDEIQLVLQDGTIVKYSVESLTVYDEATAPIPDIVGRTPNEAITLITCAGSFDPENLHYNKRLVVRGARILT
jgi:LPXTG-site transpeptidase (sortase) family protein